MPIFLDTRGMSTISIAICDRCKMKRPHAVMRNDPNFPGLRVCNEGCADEKDPYRLAARKTERINIRFPRPDQDVATTNNNLQTGEYSNAVISPEQTTSNPAQNGNLDNLSLS